MTDWVSIDLPMRVPTAEPIPLRGHIQIDKVEIRIAAPEAEHVIDALIPLLSEGEIEALRIDLAERALRVEYEKHVHGRIR